MKHIALKKIYKNLNSIFENEKELENSLVTKKEIILPTITSLNKKQKKALRLANKKNLFLILHGGIRSGKSYIALYIFISKILKAKEGELFLASGYNLSSLRTNIEQIFFDLNLICGRDYFYNSLLFRYQINGKIIRLLGANNKRSFSNVRGCTASGWYANEIVLQDKELIFECIKRVSTKKRFKIWDTNPSNSHHFIYQNFIKDAAEKKIDVVHFVTKDNLENLSEDYIKEQKNLLSENDQKIFLDGLWLENISTPFFNLKIANFDEQILRKNYFDRIAFLDPATGFSETASKSALAIIFFDNNIDGETFYFCGQTFKGLWSEHLPKIANILNYFNIQNFVYEHNLIGKGAVERELYFLKKYEGKVFSVFNNKEKIARITNLISPIEKGKMLALNFGCPDFIKDIRYANLEDKKNLDAVDALESAYTFLTN